MEKYTGLRTVAKVLLLLQGKLRTKTSDQSRALALAEAQERALKTNVSSAESTIRNMKEQVQRMKATVQQVRSQCANDIRKRDLELQKLKSHLAERQRGKREGLGVTTININPASHRASRSSKMMSGGEGLNNPGYSLKQETNEFLTQLCQGLSDENDVLIALARDTVQTLKDLQGLPHAEEDENANASASIGPQKSSQGPVTTLPESCQDLSTQMGVVLDHLRTLLTNPSFVPLEEVEMRDEEINKLREGWERMESRWRQAATMMDGWHKRIADGGDSVQMEELKLGLGLSIDTSQASAANADEDVDMESPIPEERQEVEKEEAADTQLKERPQAAGPRDLRSRKPSSRALKERNDNIQPGRSPRKVSFTPGLHGSPCERTEEDDETLLVKAHKAETVTRRPSKKKVEPRSSRKVSIGNPSFSILAFGCLGLTGYDTGTFKSWTSDLVTEACHGRGRCPSC